MHYTEITCPACKGENSRYCRCCDGVGTDYVPTMNLHLYDPSLMLEEKK